MDHSETSGGKQADPVDRYLPLHTAYKSHKSRIDQIRVAIEQGKMIEFRYTALRSARSGLRKIDPYGLWYYDGSLYLVGHCYKRRTLRTFAIERTSAVTVTETRFQIPFYFLIGDYFKDAFGVYRGEAEAVVLRFDKPASLWVRSREWHTSQQLTRLPLVGGGYKKVKMGRKKKVLKSEKT